jgi:hypothetical protein
MDDAWIMDGWRLCVGTLSKIIRRGIFGNSRSWPPAHYTECSRQGNDNFLGSTNNAMELSAVHRHKFGKLVLLGDSVTAEHYLALVCLLGFEPNFKGSRLTPQVPIGTLSNTSSHVGIPHSCLERSTTQAGSWPSQLCYIEFKSATYHSRTLSNVLDVMIRSSWLRANDVLLVNIGLFYSPRDLYHEVAAFLDVYSSAPRPRPLLVWREVTPQSFPSVDGTYEAWTRQAAGSREPQCERPPDHASERNSVLSPLLQSACLLVLRIYQPSVLAWRQHTGWRRYDKGGMSMGTTNRSRAALDCTHYCLDARSPGIFGIWSRLLLAVVRADAAEPEDDVCASPARANKQAVVP